MSDTPFHDALEQIPKNELLVKGEASKTGGKELSLTLERERGSLSGGIVAGISDTKGWSVAGFFRKVWGGKSGGT